ncbi:MAG: NADH-quinone oxidoreductase subunit N [Candidatus Ranarchaeia archaeon]|jgi:NADH-quinone oxidoreductase subunit N
MENFIYALIILGGFAFIALILDGITFKTIKKHSASVWALVGQVIALYFLVFGFPWSSTVVYDVLVLDSMAIFFAIIFLIVGIFVTLAQTQYLKNDPNQGPFYFVMLFAIVGMMLIALSNDILVMFVSWELVSIATVAMVAFRKDNVLGVEAAIKYFILSGMSSIVILLGSSYVFAVAGSLSFPVIATVAPIVGSPEYQMLILGSILLIGGFGFKMATVPFHMWLPDVYEGSPTSVSAFLAGGAKNGGFVVTIRVLVFALVALRYELSLLFAGLALITMTLGNVAALTQKDIKRMLAYSSVAQAGYVLIGFAVPTVTGLSGALFHIFNHAIMKTAAFLAVAAVIYVLGSSVIENFDGLGKRMPATAILLTIILFALAGVPPLNGFWSKLLLFVAAAEGGFIWLAIAGVLNSAFSVAYYAWIIQRMWSNEPLLSKREKEPIAILLPVLISVFIIVGTVLAIPWITTTLSQIVAQL